MKTNKQQEKLKKAMVEVNLIETEAAIKYHHLRARLDAVRAGDNLEEHEIIELEQINKLWELVKLLLRQ